MFNEKNFGKNLKCILEALCISQKELAEKSGVTEAAISQFVSGSREPSLKSVCAILRVLPVKFERLVK